MRDQRQAVISRESEKGVRVVQKSIDAGKVQTVDPRDARRRSIEEEISHVPSVLSDGAFDFAIAPMVQPYQHATAEDTKDLRGRPFDQRTARRIVQRFVQVPSRDERADRAHRREQVLQLLPRLERDARVLFRETTGPPSVEALSMQDVSEHDGTQDSPKDDVSDDGVHAAEFLSAAVAVAKRGRDAVGVCGRGAPPLVRVVQGADALAAIEGSSVVHPRRRQARSSRTVATARSRGGIPIDSDRKESDGEDDDEKKREIGASRDVEMTPKHDVRSRSSRQIGGRAVDLFDVRRFDKDQKEHLHGVRKQRESEDDEGVGDERDAVHPRVSDAVHGMGYAFEHGVEDEISFQTKKEIAPIPTVSHENIVRLLFAHEGRRDQKQSDR